MSNIDGDNFWCQVGFVLFVLLVIWQWWKICTLVSGDSEYYESEGVV